MTSAEVLLAILSFLALLLWVEAISLVNFKEGTSLVTLELSMSCQLWPGPRKSHSSHSFVSLYFSGFRGLYEHFQVTTLNLIIKMFPST